MILPAGRERLCLAHRETQAGGGRVVPAGMSRFELGRWIHGARGGRLALVVATGLALTACSFPVRPATSAEISRSSPVSPAAVPSARGSLAPGSGVAAPSPSASPPAGAVPAAPAGSGALAQLQADLRQIVDQVLPSVVEIDTGGGLGSGVVMNASGDIVTNAHVVEGGAGLTVKTAGGQSFPASMVASYPSSDLAVVRVASASGDGRPFLEPATFGDSSQVHVGDIVLAIGSPLGLLDSVSEGIVSGTGRSQPEGGGVILPDLIQTTAAVNPGNSGGALVDIGGQVIGIPTLGAGGSPRGGAAPGIGFAISSNQVKSVTSQPPPAPSGQGSVAAGGAYLGVSVAAASGGALITSVVPGGPADDAGVLAGSLITALGGRAVSDPSVIAQILSGRRPGDTISLTVQLPSGSSHTFQVVLGTHP